MDIISRYRYILFLVLIIEGSALMTVELPDTKLLSFFYGSSLYVLTAVLALTLHSPTPGYHSGEIIYAKHSTEKRLILILSIATILVLALPATASLLISTSLEMVSSAGISFASFLLLVPPMFCSGLIGILALQLFNEKKIIALTPGYLGEMKSFFSIYTVY
jgi:hypothetical protein